MSTSFLGGDSFGFISSGGGTGIPIVKLCTVPLVGNNIVDTSPKFGYNSAFYNFTVYDCTNSYSGTLVVNWNATSNQINWNQTSTVPIGTAGVTLSFAIVANNVNLILDTDSVDWKISFSKILFEDCCTPPYDSGAYIITEDGNPIITELNEYLITE